MNGQGNIVTAGSSGFGNIKLVKPSELSLDLISPNTNRNMGLKGNQQNNFNGNSGQNTQSNQMTKNIQNMQNIL